MRRYFMWDWGRMGARLWRAALGLLLMWLALAVSAQDLDAPVSPREQFNTGTRLLQTGKLREAEINLESVLTSQTDGLYAKALYNLGHVRFHQGAEELKKGPGSQPTLQKAEATSRSADATIRAAQESLNSGELQRMLGSYLRGRGTRRELKAALKQVKAAIDAHGKTLAKWQRASGDFHSASELNPQNADAKHNAQVVDRSIAKLIDSLQQLQAMAEALGQKQEELRQEMLKLKGRIPAPDMPPGAAGDDEEEEDEKPKQPEQGQQEAPNKQGEEMTGLTPEQAGWILDGFKLDSGRPLPMGQKEPPNPRDRKGRDW